MQAVEERCLGFLSSPNSLVLKRHDAFPIKGSRQPARIPRFTAIADSSFRRIMLHTRFPNTGIGGTPRFVPSVRYPDLNLFTLTWPALHKPVAGLLIVPSLVWHSGWFAGLGNALAEANVTTVSTDSLSSGRSDNIQGVKGLVFSMADYVEELTAALNRLENDLPDGTPLFVLGESGGGVPAAMVALEDSVKDKVRGYVLCGPALRVKKELLPPRIVQCVVKLIGPVFPKLKVPGEDISGDSWDQAFGDQRLSDLSKTDPYVAYGDPLLLGPGACMLKAMDQLEDVLTKGKLKMQNVLVLHKREDVRTDFEQSKKFVKRVVCDGNASLVEIDGPGHQLFQDKPNVTRDVIERVKRFIIDSAEAL